MRAAIGCDPGLANFGLALVTDNQGQLSLDQFKYVKTSSGKQTNRSHVPVKVVADDARRLTEVATQVTEFFNFAVAIAKANSVQLAVAIEWYQVFDTQNDALRTAAQKLLGAYGLAGAKAASKADLNALPTLDPSSLAGFLRQLSKSYHDGVGGPLGQRGLGHGAKAMSALGVPIALAAQYGLPVFAYTASDRTRWTGDVGAQKKDVAAAIDLKIPSASTTITQALGITSANHVWDATALGLMALRDMQSQWGTFNG